MSGVVANWDEFAAGWDDDPAARAYAAAAHESLLQLLDERGRGLADMRVLDFGCGTGLLTEHLVDDVASIDAVDTSPAMLDVLKRKQRRAGWTHVRPAGRPPGGDAVYDLIVCSSVCSFLDDYPGAVADLVSMLGADGTFVQWDWELDPVDDDPHGLTRQAIRDALTAAGLSGVVVDRAFEVTVEGVVMAPLVGAGTRSTH